MKFYYPELTFREFRKTLMSLVSNHYVSSNYCRTIHKRVFYKCNDSLRPSTHEYVGNLRNRDEFHEVFGSQNFEIIDYCGDGKYAYEYAYDDYNDYDDYNESDNNIDIYDAR
jgi:hypothetical protein